MISVIIPVYNRPQAAHGAVASVLRQRGLGAEELEVLVVDDCSTPALTLDTDDQRVRCIRSDQNVGPAGARNIGVNASRGDLIAFLDSDDVWLVDKLAQQLSILPAQFRSGTSLLAVACAFYYPEGPSRRLGVRIPRAASRLTEFVSGCWFCPGTSLLLHRSAFDRVGLFDTGLRRLEDLDWFVRFGLCGGRLIVSEHPGAIVAPSRSAATRSVAGACDQLAAKFGGDGDCRLPRRLLRHFQAYLDLERAAACYNDGQLPATMWNLVSSFVRKPRLQVPIRDHWLRSSHVPQEILACYRDMELLTLLPFPAERSRTQV